MSWSIGSRTFRFRSRESQPSRSLRTAEPIKVLESASGRRGSVRTPTRSGSNPDRGGSPRQNRVRARNVTSNRWNRWGNPSRFHSPLVVLQEAFSSSALAQVNRPGMDVAQREGEENRLVLLMLGRDDLLLVSCLNSSAALSDNDVPIWRTHESLRVRYSSTRSAMPGEGEARRGVRTWLNALLEAAKGYGSDRDYAGRGILRLGQPGVRALAWRFPGSAPNPG